MPSSPSYPQFQCSNRMNLTNASIHISHLPLECTCPEWRNCKHIEITVHCHNPYGIPCRGIPLFQDNRTFPYFKTEFFKRQYPITIGIAQSLSLWHFVSLWAKCNGNTIGTITAAFLNNIYVKVKSWRNTLHNAIEELCETNNLNIVETRLTHADEISVLHMFFPFS